MHSWLPVALALASPPWLPFLYLFASVLASTPWLPFLYLFALVLASPLPRRGRLRPLGGLPPTAVMGSFCYCSPTVQDFYCSGCFTFQIVYCSVFVLLSLFLVRILHYSECLLRVFYCSDFLLFRLFTILLFSFITAQLSYWSDFLLISLFELASVFLLFRCHRVTQRSDLLHDMPK